MKILKKKKTQATKRNGLINQNAVSSCMHVFMSSVYRDLKASITLSGLKTLFSSLDSGGLGGGLGCGGIDRAPFTVKLCQAKHRVTRRVRKGRKEGTHLNHTRKQDRCSPVKCIKDTMG